MNDLVSIITPSYNSERYIARAIESVQKQTFGNWEMIIVDDCSTDRTVNVIREYMQQDERILLIPLKNNVGAACARNLAIEAAKGRFISFLDSDDEWKNDKLLRQISFMRDNEVAFSYTAYEKINEEGRVLGKVGVPGKVDLNELLKTCVIGCSTAVYDTDYFGKVYMPSIKKRQDFGLWLKLLKNVDYAYGIPEILCGYRVRKDSLSSNKLYAAKYTWSLYRQVEGLSFVKSSYYFGHYAMRGLLRTKAPCVARFMGILK